MRNGLCPVCLTYRRLTDGGSIKMHTRHDKRCEGSLQRPKLPTPRPVANGWTSARRETLARDVTCRKCMSDSDLEVHHVKERVYGGTDELDNLIALCGNCHAEWTFCQPTGMTFETWRGLPPARWFVHILAMEWPDDISADAFKQKFLTSMAMAMNKRKP